MRADTWTDEDEALLRSLAGRTVNTQQICQEFIRHGRPRSRHAIHVHAHKLGVYLETIDWSANRLCRLFGASHAAVTHAWLESGLLPGVRTPPGLGCWRGEWRVKESDLETFIRRCPWAYDSTRMPLVNHPLTRLARAVQARDFWVQVEPAAHFLGISATAVRRWCYARLIPYQRRTVGVQGGRGGAIVIRASDLPALKLEIEARHAAARQLIRSKIAEFNERRRTARIAA